MNTIGEKDGIALFPEGMVEFDLCLPGWQAAALEEAAHSRGLTAGQLLRGMIQDYFSRFVRNEPAHGNCVVRSV